MTQDIDKLVAAADALDDAIACRRYLVDDARALILQSRIAADAITKRLEEAEAERAEQWRQRREAEGSRDACKAANDTLRAELEAAKAGQRQYLIELSKKLGGLSRYINEQGDYRSDDDWASFLLARTEDLLHSEGDQRRRANAAEDARITTADVASRILIRAEAAEARAAQLEAENGRLREALEPFAAMADHYPTSRKYGNRPSAGPIFQTASHDVGEAEITVEHLHAASAALTGREG